MYINKMVKTLAMVVTLGLGVLFSNTALAQTPSDESLARYLTVTNFKTGFKESFIASSNSAIKVGVLNQIAQAYPDATPEQMAAAQKVVEEVLFAHTAKLMEDPRIYEIAHKTFIGAAKTHFTQQQIDAMNKFYSTPIGQDIIKKQSTFLTEVSDKLMVQLIPVVESISTPAEEHKLQMALFAKLHEIFK